MVGEGLVLEGLELLFEGGCVLREVLDLVLVGRELLVQELVLLGEMGEVGVDGWGGGERLLVIGVVVVRVDVRLA